MDTGIEKIEGGAVLAQVRRQARKVNVESALAAGVLTILLLLVPS